MIESHFGDIEETLDTIQRKFYGVIVGEVTNVADPMALGRVQVRIPVIDEEDMMPWARVAASMAGATYGTYMIPDVGTRVLVAFEHGDLNAPYVLGSLWDASSPPPLPSPTAQVRVIRTPSGNQITFAETPPTVTIQTATGQTITMSPTGIQITSGGNVINMTPEGITINAATSLNVSAGASVNISAPNITINGAAVTEVKSGGVCNMTAPLVKIN